ncbi:hypothetical protein DMA11_02600 [Marinilabiliaceae bacterium JC017]|nr:hypothetical protein DMA11_02600 [Marinilabiliaceae bacterium JC017]
MKKLDKLNTSQSKKLFNKKKSIPIKSSTLKLIFPYYSKLICGKKEKLYLILGIIKSASEITILNNTAIIRVNFIAHQFGPKPGQQWIIKFPKLYQELSLNYNLYIPKSFDFNKEGKLPGLAGGKPLGGGDIPTGYNGWSSRMMFLKGGKLCVYLYHYKMKTEFGRMLLLHKSNSKPYLLQKDSWINIKQSIRLNSINNSDGKVIIYINNKQMLKVDNICFRKTEKLNIDKLIFSCFIGGDKIGSGPDNQTFLCFNNFQLSQDHRSFEK